MIEGAAALMRHPLFVSIFLGQNFYGDTINPAPKFW